MKFSQFFLSIVVFFYLPFSQATFIGDSQGNLYNYDSFTNSSVLIGNTGSMFDIALNPITNILYGISGSGNLFEIDQNDASTNLIGNTNNQINGLTFDNSGILYGSGGSGLFSIDLLSGAANLIGNGDYISSGDIAFDNMGNLFLSSTTGPDNSLWALDISSGVGTFLGDIGFDNVFGLDFIDNSLLGFTQFGETIEIDRLTGMGNFLFDNEINAFGADGSGGVSVPEPSSIVLLVFGLLMMLVHRRKLNA